MLDPVRQLLAIVSVFALLAAGLWLLRKKTGRTKQTPGLLESQGKLVLTARHSIHLIRIGDRQLIVALHPEGICFLGDAAPAAVRDRKDIAIV
jgi:flagellar biogenesis protein FliO